MTRGRKIPFSELLEVHPTDKHQYRCLVCKEHGISDLWMHKGSWKTHYSKGKGHANAMKLREAVLSAQEQTTWEARKEDYLSFGGMEEEDTPTGPPQPYMSMAEGEIWRQLRSGEYTFAMDDPDIERENNEKDFERQWEAYNRMAGVEHSPMGVLDNGEGIFGPEEDEMAENIESASVTVEEILTDFHRTNGLKPSSDCDWYPYPSKLAFLLDTIDNIPRTRISATIMEVFLLLLREVGVTGVPSMSVFRKMQVELREMKGVPTLHRLSPKGNAYSFNDPVDIIVKDWSKPSVRRHLRRYPVLPKDSVVSEIWHGEKWRKTMDRHAMSPMYDDLVGHKHFYIDEPAQMVDGSMVVPIRWLEDERGEVWFDAWKVVGDENGLATIMDQEGSEVLIRAKDLRENMLDLQDQSLIPAWSEITTVAGHPLRMPNPDRKLAQGEPLYVSFIDIFGDDVSGNLSKSWNKHWNIYIKHRNLPRKVMQQDSHTHFVSTSPNATILEQFQGIKEIIEYTHITPAHGFDCQTGKPIRVKLQCNCEPGDNPAQSEASGHIGSSGNHPCRKCTMGGSKEYKTSDEGFGEFFKPGIPRSAEDTLEKIKEQVGVACTGVASHVSSRQKETGVKDAYTQSWIESLIGWSREREARGQPPNEIQAELRAAVEDHGNELFNPFLTLRYSDVTQDTPVEILHTVLLGIVKYTWHSSHTDWKEVQKSLFCSRLQATETRGLSIPAIRAGYIMQYANSLIGRQFKILAQTNVFHMHDLVDERQYSSIKAIGVLSALLWTPEITDMTVYLEDLEVAVANVLDTAAALDPSKVIAKIKYHLLTHTPDDVKRNGPIIGVATESYESFNTIFRHCSILSNHISPSRDIAFQLAEQETFRHISDGGWWKEGSPESGVIWNQAGEGLRSYVDTSKMHQRLFHTHQKTNTVGSVVLKTTPHENPPARSSSEPRPMYKLSETEAQTAILSGVEIPSSVEMWYQCKSIIGASGDDCRVGTWVFSRNRDLAPGDNHPSTVFAGRIVEILSTVEGSFTFVVVERFQISDSLHPRFDMPVLYLPFGESMRLAVYAKDILFDFNAQHDCYTAKCAATGSKPMMQEREESGKVEKVINHDFGIARFVINSHNFHNSHRLRSIPGLRELLKPKLLYPDRRQHHRDAAAHLRSQKATLDSQTDTTLAPAGSHLKDVGAQGPAKKRKRGDGHGVESASGPGQPRIQQTRPGVSRGSLEWAPIVVGET